MNIVFDLDGTLIDASERMYRLFQDLVPTSSFTKEEYWEKKRCGISHQRILKQYFPNIDFELFSREWLQNIEKDDYLLLDRNYPETPSTLDALKNNTLILLTARQNRPALLLELDRFKIKKYFAMILATEGKKKKSELLETAIGTIHRSDDDMLIGDTGSDILTGKEMHFKSVAITHGFMDRKILQEAEPHYIIDSLSELITMTV